MADTCYFPPRHYQAATFKGVSLGVVLECDSQHGRRGAEGEFPFGESTSYADLGRRIRRFRIKAMFPKSTHVADVAAAIAACESPNAGTLVHPVRGNVMAACKNLHVVDNPEDAAGVTYIEAEFVEANTFLAGIAGLIGGLGLGLGDLLGAVQDAFAGSYDVGALPVYDVGAAVTATADVVSTIRDAFSGAVGFSADSNVTRIQTDLQTVTALPDTLMRPITAWQAISNGIAAVNRYGVTPAAVVDAQRAIINTASQSSAGPAAPVREAVYQATRIIAAAYMAQATISDTTATSQELCARYNAFVAVMGEEILAARNSCDNTLHLALRLFMATTQKAMLARIYSAPLIVQYDFHGGVFGVVAAHEIYGDGRRFAEIEARNPAAPPYHIGPVVAAVRA